MVIDENTVLTAAHLVGNDDRPTVTFDGETVESRLEVWSSEADLAILRMAEPLATPVQMADADSYEVGDPATLTAKADDGDDVTATGTIQEFYLPGNFRASFESSAGLSGGAVTNGQDELMGINIGSARTGDGTFVVESALVEPLRDLSGDLDVVEGADCDAYTTAYSEVLSEAPREEPSGGEDE